MTEQEAIDEITSDDYCATLMDKQSCELGEALCMVIEALEKQINDRWTPVTWHETTDEDGIDKEKYPITLDCRMPEDGEEILVCNKKSVWQDTCFNDDGYYLDSGNAWIDDVIAWKPLPEPYKELQSS